MVASSTNQQYRFGMPGSEISVQDQNQISQFLERLQPFPEFIVISGSLPPGMPPEFLRQLVKTAKENGAKVIVDTSEEALKQVIEEGVFLLKTQSGRTWPTGR